jgi:cysteine-rich repeat protein
MPWQGVCFRGYLPVQDADALARAGPPPQIGSIGWGDAGCWRALRAGRKEVIIHRMLHRTPVLLAVVPLVVLVGCANAGSKAVDGGRVGGTGGVMPSGTAGRDSGAADVGAGAASEAGSTGGMGGTTLSAKGGTAGGTTFAGSNDGAVADAPLPTDVGLGSGGGTSVPVTSRVGTGGTSIPVTSRVGTGGTSAPVSSSGGAGGATGSAICGDGKIEGGEGCDDGNHTPFDGCSIDCQLEPDCSGGSCTSACGDGIVFGSEACDDANHASGDGCSVDCKTE